MPFCKTIYKIYSPRVYRTGTEGEWHFFWTSPKSQLRTFEWFKASSSFDVAGKIANELLIKKYNEIL